MESLIFGETMKQTFCLTIPVILNLLLPLSSSAEEGMSTDEIAVREEHDSAKKTLFKCFAKQKRKKQVEKLRSVPIPVD